MAERIFAVKYCNMLGISRQTLTVYEKETIKFSMDKAKKLSDIFNVAAEHIENAILKEQHFDILPKL
jgi:predicted transcriptional regulator